MAGESAGVDDVDGCGVEGDVGVEVGDGVFGSGVDVRGGLCCGSDEGGLVGGEE